jgi:ribosomal protein S18 acetylase RimI-like enzyme
VASSPLPDSHSPQAISLRPARLDEAEFLYRVYASTRYEELAPTGWTSGQIEDFLRMQFRAQDTYYREQNADAAFDVILYNGQPVGRLYVLRDPTELRIIDIALLPEFRRAGIGSKLLGQLLTEATATGVPVRIYVEVFNPALRLYERLGFVRIASTGVYYQMEWRPAGMEVANSTPAG